MESHAKYTLVGSIVVLLVVSIALTLFWLSRQRADADTRLYTIYFRKFSLSGLQVNSWVTMRGIKVGSVESLQISPKDIELVKVVLRLQNNTPVKLDTEAVIERNLLTGLASIDLVNSTQESQLLAASEHEEYPVIPEGKTTLGAIQDNLPQLMDKVSQMTTRFNNVFSPENERLMNATLSNLRDISAVVAEHNSELGEGIKNLSSLASSLQQLTKNFDTRSAQVTQSMTHTSEIIALEVTRAGQSLGAMAETMQRTLGGYEDPRSLLRGPAASARGPGEEAR